MDNFRNHLSSFIVVLVTLPTTVQSLMWIYLCGLLLLWLSGSWSYGSGKRLRNLLLRYRCHRSGRCTNILLLLSCLMLWSILSVLHRYRRCYWSSGHHLLLRCCLRRGSRSHLRWRCLWILHEIKSLKSLPNESVLKFVATSTIRSNNYPAEKE